MRAVSQCVFVCCTCINKQRLRAGDQLWFDADSPKLLVHMDVQILANQSYENEEIRLLGSSSTYRVMFRGFGKPLKTRMPFEVSEFTARLGHDLLPNLLELRPCAHAHPDILFANVLVRYKQHVLHGPSCCLLIC